MNSITDSENWIFASPTRTLAYADELDSPETIGERYHLWNLKRHNWSDDDILDRAPHYHTNLIEAMKEL